MSSEPSSPKASRKRARNIRKASADDISIQELFPDDMGYDADVEILRPDKIEEPDSESESESVSHEKLRTIDEELAARMRRLGGDESLEPLLPTSSERGRKRKSRNTIDDDFLNIPRSPGLEIQELVDTADRSSPAKRRRRRSRRPNIAQHILRSHNDMWTDSSDKTDGKETKRIDRSTSPTTASERPANRGEEDEAMDIS